MVAKKKTIDLFSKSSDFTQCAISLGTTLSTAFPRSKSCKVSCQQLQRAKALQTVLLERFFSMMKHGEITVKIWESYIYTIWLFNIAMENHHF
jgi:hypothetical protein